MPRIDVRRAREVLRQPTLGTRPVSSPVRITQIGSLQIIILGVVIAAMMLVFGTFFQTTSNSPTSPAKSDIAQPEDSAVASLIPDSTLSYASHMSDVSIYFIGTTPTCIIDSEPFGDRGGSAYRNVTTYSVKTLGNSEWQIRTGAIGNDARSNQNFVFWVTRTNGDAANGQPAIEAKGNIYDWAGHAMWSGGEQIMDLKFVRGNHINPAALPEGNANANVGKIPQGDVTSELPSSDLASFPGERFPDTRLRRMTNEEVVRMSPAVIRYAINEMYARHGADFRDEEIKAYFKRFAWYHLVPGKSYDVIESEFTDVERDNIKLLGMYRDAQRKEISANVAPGLTTNQRHTRQKQSERPGNTLSDRTRGLDNL